MCYPQSHLLINGDESIDLKDSKAKKTSNNISTNNNSNSGQLSGQPSQ